MGDAAVGVEERGDEAPARTPPTPQPRVWLAYFTAERWTPPLPSYGLLVVFVGVLLLLLRAYVTQVRAETADPG